MIVNKNPADLIWPEDFINKIICGDCLEVMKKIPDGAVDLVLTDPPYGVKRDGGFGGAHGFRGSGRKIVRRQYSDDWDGDIPPRETFNIITTWQACTVLIFGGNFFSHILPRSSHWIFWDKKQTMPTFGDGELLWTNIKRHSVRKIELEYNGLIGKEENRQHPTQKPLKLLRLLVKEHTCINEIVCDPFLGSGTTAVAAKQLGRRFIGIEINMDYCKIAEDRLRQEELF